MLKTLGKLYAYKKSPVQTFALLHPMRALRWGVIFLIVRTVMRRFRASAGLPPSPQA